MEKRTKTFFLILVLVIVAGAQVVPDSISAQQCAIGDDLPPVHSQVLVIGAGSSGVATASRLLENGVLDVTILEAEDRLGGRTHTIPFGNNDVVDLGAQWVHGVQGNAVYEMANPLGLLEENATGYDENARYLRGNGVELETNLVTQFLNITELIIKNTQLLANYNGSFGQLHDEKFDEHIANLGIEPSLANSCKKWLEKVFLFSSGSDTWYTVSTKWIAQYRPCPGDQMVNWKNNGYYSIINLLTKRYPDPTKELPVRNKTRLNSEVKTIHWGPYKVPGPAGKDVVFVETSIGTKYTADIVVVTVPLGVLKANPDTMFNPSLPDKKMNAIQHVGFGQVDKLYLHFNETWWPTNVTGFGVIVTENDRERFNELYPQYMDKGEWINGLTGFYAIPRQRKHVLFDWIVGEPARNMEKYSDEEVKNGCVQWLQMSLNRTIPAPVAFTRSKWYSNPHFRGSYSHRSLDSVKYDAQYSHIAEPLKGDDGTPEVLFAGEATNDEHYSTVHGAVESGWREADRILALLRKENRAQKPATSA